MKKLQLTRYLRKILPIILVLCVLATCVIHFNLKKSNTYVASEVIHYNDPAAEQGLTPTGSKLDVNEIKSSAIMSKVVDRVGLAGIYSVDSLISRVTITPLPDSDKLAQKEAKLEEGEEYVYEPSTYIVSFTATDSEGPNFARTILDETLDVYFAEYSQKYVNVTPANNIIDNIESENYDYIELIEIIDTGIEQTLSTLYQRMSQNPYYRATGTGISFNDLADEFNYIRSVKLSSLFSEIYKYQVTKSKAVLVADYTTRIDRNDMVNAKEDSIVADTVAIINAYVKKMRESGNTNITYEYILDNIHERNLTEYYTPGDQTVTYDELIYGWRDHNEIKEYSVIDTAYCQYIIDTFSSCTGACKNKECRASEKTCTQLNLAEYAQIQDRIDTEIKALTAELGNLYNLTMRTNDEYNQYLGASYISMLSTASVKASINVGFYTVIAFFFLVILCGGGAVVLSRIGDIIQYVFYTDHLTELPNRSGFDRYLKSMHKKVLDDGMVCCLVDIVNLSTINSNNSRETGDAVIKMFTTYLKDTFGKTPAEFFYNDVGCFVIFVEDSDAMTMESDFFRLFRLKLDDREEHREIKIEYKIGIAQNIRDGKTARELLADATANKKLYESAPAQE